MRGATEQLEVASSLIEGLPSIYRADDFLGRLVDAFDTVLAPVHGVIDNLDAYCDPSLTPDDFLPWIARWVGVSLDERWPMRRRRELIRAAPELYRMRGTVRGVTSAVALYTGLEPEVIENGGCVYDGVPNASYPGRPELGLVVRVRTSSADVDRSTVEAIVAQSKPAHVPHRVEVVVVGA